MAKLSAKLRLPALVLTLLAISSSVQGTTINVRSQCSSALTACSQAQGTGVACFVLNNGGSNTLDVGAVWTGGLIWGYPGDSNDPVIGNNAKPQANLAEFTIGSGDQDFYDLSNVNAYNLALQINPTDIAGGGTVDGSHCGSPSCTIPDLTSFCQPPNTLSGAPGEGCINTDGPGTVATDGTKAFKAVCPTSYSYSQDDQNPDPPVVYGCNLGSNYEVVFCP